MKGRSLTPSSSLLDLISVVLVFVVLMLLFSLSILALHLLPTVLQSGSLNAETEDIDTKQIIDKKLIMPTAVGRFLSDSVVNGSLFWLDYQMLCHYKSSTIWLLDMSSFNGCNKYGSTIPNSYEFFHENQFTVHGYNNPVWIYCRGDNSGTRDTVRTIGVVSGPYPVHGAD